MQNNKKIVLKLMNTYNQSKPNKESKNESKFLITFLRDNKKVKNHPNQSPN